MAKQSSAGFLIAKIHQTAGRIFSQLLRKKKISLNPAQGRIMFVLWQSDNISIQDLSKRTALEKSTLTSMLDRLEEEGWLKRVPSPTDRRQILIQRSEKDRTWQTCYDETSMEMTALFFKGFSNPEIEQFDGMLERILANLADHERKLRHK